MQLMIILTCSTALCSIQIVDKMLWLLWLLYNAVWFIVIHLNCDMYSTSLLTNLSFATWYLFHEGGSPRQWQRTTIFPPVWPKAWTFGAPEGEPINYLKRHYVAVTIVIKVSKILYFRFYCLRSASIKQNRSMVIENWCGIFAVWSIKFLPCLLVTRICSALSLIWQKWQEYCGNLFLFIYFKVNYFSLLPFSLFQTGLAGSLNYYFFFFFALDDISPVGCFYS